MAEENELHIQNIKNILTSLGCQPINPDDFKKKIEDYIEKSQ